MKENDRIRAYAAQQGIASAGSFKNGTTKKKLVSKLTPKQQKRLARKAMSNA